MKKIVILGVIFLIVLSVIGCSTAGEKKHFKGLKIETWTDGDKFSFKTDDSESEWTTEKVLPKELSQEEKFAVRAWKDIMSIHMSSNMKRIDREKAMIEVKLRIEALAVQLKEGKANFKWTDIYVGPGSKDIKKALAAFWQNCFIAADRFGGNGNGYCSTPEIEKLMTSLQVQLVEEVTRMYK